MIHSNSLKNHRIENWVYATAAARTGATGLITGDVGKIAFQTDTGEYWRLTAIPSTWVQVGGSAPSGKIETFTYANEAARTGATGLVAGDVGKLSYQTDTGKYYRLLNQSPVTWSDPLNGGGGAAVAATHAYVEGVLSGAQILFSAIPATYRTLRIVGRVRASSFGDFGVQINGDTGFRYWWQRYIGQSASGSNTNGNSDYGTSGETSIKFAPSNADGVYLDLCIPFYSQTVFDSDFNLAKALIGTAVIIDGAPRNVRFAGKWGNGDAFAKAAVSSVRVFCDYAGATMSADSRLRLELSDPI